MQCSQTRHSGLDDSFPGAISMSCGVYLQSPMITNFVSISDQVPLSELTVANCQWVSFSKSGSVRLSLNGSCREVVVRIGFNSSRGTPNSGSVLSEETDVKSCLHKEEIGSFTLPFSFSLSFSFSSSFSSPFRAPHFLS